MMEEEADACAEKESQCLIGELDGVMVPIVTF